MSDDARSSLARAQTELVRALTAQTAPPASFDTARLTLAAIMLQQKRARAVARTWPNVAQSLGPTFDEEFATYAAAHPLSQPGEAITDGLRFLRFLDSRLQLPDEARLEWLTQRARRHGLAITRLKSKKRFAVCFRLPWRARLYLIRI